MVTTIVKDVDDNDAAKYSEYSIETERIKKELKSNGLGVLRKRHGRANRLFPLAAAACPLVPRALSGPNQIASCTLRPRLGHIPFRVLRFEAPSAPQRVKKRQRATSGKSRNQLSYLWIGPLSHAVSCVLRLASSF